jgi:hypothetical protein
MLTQNDKNILRFIEDHGGLTIFQCYRIFYRDKKYGHDMARKRLAVLYKNGIVRKTKNRATDEVIYYLEKHISPHDVLLLDFYSMLVFNNAEVLEFRREPTYELLGTKIRPDGFVKFRFNGIIQGCFIEVDFTHATNVQKYDPFVNGYFKKLYGGNPAIVIITENPKNYKSSFDIINLDYKLNDFTQRVLG